MHLQGRGFTFLGAATATRPGHRARVPQRHAGIEDLQACKRGDRERAVVPAVWTCNAVGLAHIRHHGTECTWTTLGWCARPRLPPFLDGALLCATTCGTTGLSRDQVGGPSPRQSRSSHPRHVPQRQGRRTPSLDCAKAPTELPGRLFRHVEMSPLPRGRLHLGPACPGRAHGCPFPLCCSERHALKRVRPQRQSSRILPAARAVHLGRPK